MADVLLSCARGPSGFNKLVVLKTMRRELVADSELRQMFLAEARLSARLNHPNVVQVYEVVDSALPCIVMEYLDGQPMSSLQSEGGQRFTLPLQLKVISEALAGLHYSHEVKDYDGTPLNIVHRDVSPQNIFITCHGVVKVLDFGIAKASTAGVKTETGIVKGKIAYMSPQQLLGEELDRRADIYSVGCMLWHAATGVRLWARMADGEVIRALVAGSIPKPSSACDVDPRLETIIMKALAPAAEDRYSTAMELKLAVDEFLVDASPGASAEELGALLSDVFADALETRKRQIQTALAEPSVRPLPVPAGMEGLVSSTGITHSMLAKERRRQVSWSVGAAVGVVVVALAVAFAFFAQQERGRKVVAQNSAGLPSGAPSQIQIRLGAAPSVATLWVDGRVTSANPAVLTVQADNGEHEIRAASPGYEPAIRKVRFDRDLSLELVLLPLPPSTPSASSEIPSARPKPVAGQRRPVRPATTPVVKSPPNNCDPPFRYENGIKMYKPGCV
jgi:serine/threonine-protein kinase